MTAEPFERRRRDSATSASGPNSPIFGHPSTPAFIHERLSRTRQESGQSTAIDANPAPSVTEEEQGRAEENSRWTQDLTCAGPAREAAADALYAYLLRAARSELAHRSSTSRLSGPERDDLAHQSAADALVSVIRRIPDFRGESKFTTWARSFVTFEVRVKVRQHNRRSGSHVLVEDDWDRLTPLGSSGPDAEVEAFELRQAVLAALATDLTARQRAVFLGIVVHGASIEQLAAQLGSNRNAIYQLMFHARRNVRRHLTQRGFLVGIPAP